MGWAYHLYGVTGEDYAEEREMGDVEWAEAFVAAESYELKTPLYHQKRTKTDVRQSGMSKKFPGVDPRSLLLGRAGGAWHFNFVSPHFLQQISATAHGGPFPG